MGAPSFFERKMVLLAGIMRDASLTASAKVLGYALVDYINEAAGYAWPGQAYLCKNFGLDEKTVRRGTRALENGRYFEVRKEGRSFTYHPVWRGADPDPKSEKMSAVIPGKIPGHTGNNARQIPDKNGAQSLLIDPVELSFSPARQQAARITQPAMLLPLVGGMAGREKQLKRSLRNRGALERELAKKVGIGVDQYVDAFAALNIPFLEHMLWRIHQGSFDDLDRLKVAQSLTKAALLARPAASSTAEGARLAGASE